MSGNVPPVVNQSEALAAEVHVLLDELVREGQRALVIAGSARIDIALEHLLKRAMRHHAGTSDSLFDNDRPLGTFAAKIALAHRLSLVSDQIEKALELVRRIRNDFAHSVESANLCESAHSSRLRELLRVCDTPNFRTVLENYRRREGVTEQVAIFSTALGAILIALEMTAHFLTPLDPNVSAKFI